MLNDRMREIYFRPDGEATRADRPSGPRWSFRVDGGLRTIYVQGMRTRSRIKAGIANQTVEAG